MHDIGHKAADEAIERLAARFSDVYAQALREVSKKTDAYFDRFRVKDELNRRRAESGEISEDASKEWRRRQMFTGNRWTDLRDAIAKDMTNANQLAAAAVRGEVNGVYAINANYAEYMIENGMRTNYGFTLYDTDTVARLLRDNPELLPDIDVKEDLKWNRQQIASAITQGILQGESIPDISKRLYNVVDKNKTSAVRTARTAMTSAQNAGRQEVYNRAEKMGLNLKKEWLATLDGRTRHAHGMADGQRVKLTETFTVEGYKMKFPGDPSAPGHLVYNCRCTMITVEPEHITKGEEPRRTYSEWQYQKVKDNLGNNAPKTLANFKGIWYNEDRKKTFENYEKSLKMVSFRGLSILTSMKAPPKNR